jgi:hypothetical protein
LNIKLKKGGPSVFSPFYIKNHPFYSSIPKFILTVYEKFIFNTLP